MKKTKAEELLENRKNSNNISGNDKNVIYNNYLTYINKNSKLKENEKDVIFNYLRNMLMHSNKVLLMDELDNYIYTILQATKEKEILSKNLKLFMEYKNLNVTDLANKLDLPYSTVNDWVNGVSYPRVDKLNRLANAFGVTKKDLTEPHENNRNKVPVLGNIPARYPY